MLLSFFSKEIMNEVLKSKKNGTDWRVLIVDRLSMRMVSACCKMHEIASEGITSKFIFVFQFWYLCSYISKNHHFRLKIIDYCRILLNNFKDRIELLGFSNI